MNLVYIYFYFGGKVGIFFFFPYNPNAQKPSVLRGIILTTIGISDLKKSQSASPGIQDPPPLALSSSPSWPSQL